MTENNQFNEPEHLSGLKNKLLGLSQEEQSYLLDALNGSPSFEDKWIKSTHRAVKNSLVLELSYISSISSSPKSSHTLRQVEPIGIFYYSHHWHLIGYCLLRNEYRDFRLDKVRSLEVLGLNFKPQERVTLVEYLKSVQVKKKLKPVLIKVSPMVHKVIAQSKWTMGFVRELPQVDENILLEFWTNHLENFARWVISLVPDIEVIEPVELNQKLKDLAQQAHSIFNQ